MPCLFFWSAICDQRSNINFEIMAQLANQSRINSFELVLAVTIEVGTRDIQVLAKLIFRDISLLQNLLYIESKLTVLHNMPLFTLLALLYIMRLHLITPCLVNHYIAIL